MSELHTYMHSLAVREEIRCLSLANRRDFIGVWRWRQLLFRPSRPALPQSLLKWDGCRSVPPVLTAVAAIRTAAFPYRLVRHTHRPRSALAACVPMKASRSLVRSSTRMYVFNGC